MSLSGDSIAIFIRCDKLVSFKLLCSLILMSLIREKLHSTEAVETGRDKLIVAMVCRFGNMVVNMSFETMSVSFDFIFSLGFIAINRRYDIHSVWISEEICAFLTVGSPSDVLPSLSVP